MERLISTMRGISIPVSIVVNFARVQRHSCSLLKISTDYNCVGCIYKYAHWAGHVINLWAVGCCSLKILSICSLYCNGNTIPYICESVHYVGPWMRAINTLNVVIIMTITNWILMPHCGDLGALLQHIGRSAMSCS